MNATQVISRMMVSPNPTAWYRRNLQRLMLAEIQPEDDPSVITVRPYGIAKGVGMSTMPVDYTLSHYGGTLRGQKIGRWRESLMVAPDPQPINAPTQYAWRGSKAVQKIGTMWIQDDDEEV